MVAEDEGVRLKDDNDVVEEEAVDFGRVVVGSSLESKSGMSYSSRALTVRVGIGGVVST